MNIKNLLSFLSVVLLVGGSLTARAQVVCESDPGAIAIMDQVLCPNETTMVMANNVGAYPIVSTDGGDDADDQTGQYVFTVYHTTPAPLPTDPFFTPGDASFIVLDVIGDGTDPAFSLSNNSEGYPTNTVISVVGDVRNDSGLLPLDGGGNPTCQAPTEYVQFILLDPITYDVGTCSCVNGSAQVTISNFAGGAPGAVAANGGPVLGLQDTNYTITANDGTVINDMAGNPLNTVAVGGSVTIDLPGGGAFSFLIQDEEGCNVTEAVVACDPCGCTAGTLNSTDYFLCVGETLDLNAMGVEFPNDTLLTDNDELTGMYVWDFYFADAPGVAGNPTGPQPIDPFSCPSSTAGDVQDITAAIGGFSNNNITNIGVGTTTAVGAALPTNTLIQLSGAAWSDNTTVDCADDLCAVGYVEFVLLEPLAVDSIGLCDCSGGATSPSVTLFNITGGMPSYDPAMTYTVEAFGGTPDATSISAGDDVVLALDTDGGNWAVTITDSGGCETFVSGNCAACCAADAGHLDLDGRLVCAEDVITIVDEDIQGFPVDWNSAVGDLEDFDPTTGLVNFDFYNVNDPANPVLIQTTAFGTDTINDANAPQVSITGNTFGANTIVAVSTAVGNEDGDFMLAECEAVSETQYFVTLDVIQATQSVCTCNANEIDPVVTISNFAGGEPGAFGLIPALNTLGFTDLGIDDPQYYLTANGATVNTAVATVGGSIDLTVTDPDGNWSLIIEDQNGCQTVLSGTCESCCILDITASANDEICDEENNGTVTVMVLDNPNMLELEFALIEGGGAYDGMNAGPFQNSTFFEGVAPGTYAVVARHVGDYSCQAEFGDFVVGGGILVAPPTTTSAEVCQLETAPGIPLTAECSFACPPDGSIVTWWTQQNGGSLVYTGTDFDPVAEGYISPDDLSYTEYWAQCECGTCVSERTVASYLVQYCCDVEITSADVTATEGCEDNSFGEITVTAAGSSNAYEFALVIGGDPFDGQNATGFQTSPNFTNLPAGLYTVVVRDIENPINPTIPGVYCYDELVVEITAVIVGIDAPTTTDGYVCEGGFLAAEVLVANCSLNMCAEPGGNIVTWWTEQFGGSLLSQGENFDPVFIGAVNPNIVQSTSFWAQCGCGDCASLRTEAVFIVRPLPEVQEIQGAESVCPGATETYSVEQVGNNTYEWIVLPPNAGTISGAGNEIDITWSAAPPNGNGPYTIVVTETDEFDCSVSYEKEVLIEIVAQMFCNNQVNGTLDNQECSLVISPDDLLEYPLYPDASYMVQIEDLDGNVVATSSVDAGGNYIPAAITEKGAYTYSVTHLCSGQFCWGNILAEDKAAPVLTCPEDVIDDPLFVCTDLDTLFTEELTLLENTMVDPPFQDDLVPGNATAFDNCGMYRIEYFDTWQQGDSCSYDAIIRTFVATDMSGNSSQCEQEIRAHKPTLDMVTLPGQLEIPCAIVNDPSLPPSELLAAGYDEAYPYIDTYFGHHHLDPLYCNIGATYEDAPTIDLCGGGFKIIRSWTVFDWCNPADVFITVQVLKVEDEIAPDIVCPVYPDVAANNAPFTCTGVVVIQPLASISEVCSDPVSTSAFVTAEDGTITDVLVGEQISLPVGAHSVTYTATDNCGNVSIACTAPVNVVDETPPVAVCDEHTTVALGSDGNAEICWQTFDDFSYDNCEILAIKVKRMDGEGPFTDCVEFDCADVGQTVMVRMRVYDILPENGFPDDETGRWNECMVEVDVQDKLNPILTCPADKTVECQTAFAELDQVILDEDGVVDTDALYPAVYYAGVFQGYYPGAYDNCIGDVEVTDEGELDQCGEGIVYRTWLVTDVGGRTDICTQIITIENSDPFDGNDEDDLDWPNDANNVDCGEGTEPDDLPNGRQRPEFIEDACDLIAVTYEDEYLPVVDSACYKILRHWTVIDWCQFDGEINGGVWTHTQVIKVNDNVGPTIDEDLADVTICTFTDDCIELLDFSLAASDDCSDEVTTHLFIDGYADGNVFDVAAIGLPAGIHSVIWTVTDGCGNETVGQYDLTVVDCKQPTPVLINGIASVIMPSSGELTMWASDFNAPGASGSFDNCTPQEDLVFGIRIVSPSNDPITSVDEILALGTSVLFNCDNLGFAEVEVYVIDNEGNWDYGVTYIQLQDNADGICVDYELAAIEGFIETEVGEAVGLVTVGDFVTGDDGVYALQLPLNTNQTLEPEKDINPMNGVTTYDLVSMTSCILGTGENCTPYKMIAADINRSNSVTTYDVVLLRRMILGIDADFTSNTSWRFVDRNYVFPDPTNPFLTVFPEVISLNDLSDDEFGLDFIGIKIGDLNNSAIPNMLLETEARNAVGTLTFQLENEKVVAGETYEIAFKAKDFKAISGYQFTLSFDTNVLEFEGISNSSLASVNENNFGLHKLAEGIITTSWNEAGAIALKDNETVFALNFTAKKSGTLMEAIGIGSQYTQAEAYNADADLLDVALAFHTNGKATIVGAGFELMQNVPNPFEQETTINFFLPTATNASLTIFDVAGKVLKVIEKDYAKGYNQVVLNANELNVSGVLYYQLETATHTATKRMFITK